MIKYDKKLPCHYISMSDIQGICLPMKPLQGFSEHQYDNQGRVDYEAYLKMQNFEQRHQRSISSDSDGYGLE